MRYECLELNKERRACCAGGKTRQEEGKATEKVSCQNVFLLTSAGTQPLPQSMSSLEKIMSQLNSKEINGYRSIGCEEAKVCEGLVY